MAKCIINPDADVQTVRRIMQKKGYTLRAYKQADGTEKYTLQEKIRQKIQKRFYCIV